MGDLMPATAFKEIDRRAVKPRVRPWRWVVGATAGAIGLGLALLVPELDLGFDPEEGLGMSLAMRLFIGIGLAAVCACSTIFVVDLLLDLLRRGRRAEWRRIRALEVERLEEIPTRHEEPIVGTITRPAGPPLRAPLAAEDCVALRIVGGLGDQQIDDAEVTSFFLEVGEDREPVLVEAGAAIVDLEADHAENLEPERLEGLREFLGTRGLEPSVTPALLAESLLRCGDAVEVCGAVTTRPNPGGSSGYRAAAHLRVVSGTPVEPLRLRRPE
jgi:hypothetical protein